MEERNFASRKSRLVFHRADGATIWRAIGSVTIFSSKRDKPVVLNDQKVTMVVHEPRSQGELRDALVFLEPLQRPLWVTVYWFFLAMFLGAALMRVWYKMF